MEDLRKDGTEEEVKVLNLEDLGEIAGGVGGNPTYSREMIDEYIRRYKKMGQSKGSLIHYLKNKIEDKQSLDALISYVQQMWDSIS